jgi:hypothetical protein
MADYNFTTNPGETVARELLVAYLNTGTAESPVWSPLGKRVEDSSAEYDWGESTSQDILGNAWAKLKKPIITQTFEPCDLDAGDEAQKKIWQLAVVEQNAQALSNMDLLIAHLYAGFGERYESCMVKPSSLGGEGGGNIGMPLDITYGGKRSIGSVTNTGGTIKFTPEVTA